jgi:hypothetical protein
VTGPGAYGLTPVIAVEGAPAGALAPAQTFDAADFLDAVAPHGVTWQST